MKPIKAFTFVSTARQIALLLTITFAPLLSPAATIVWNAASGSDIGVAANWTGGVLPSAATPDTAQWNNTPAGALSLSYTNTTLAGAAGNAGINLSMTAINTGALTIDSGLNTANPRFGNVTLASGAGAFTLGNSANTFNITLGGGASTQTWQNDSANTATINSDVVFALGGSAAHTLALAGAGNWAFNNALGNGGGTLTLTKAGAGTATLSGANAYTGNTTITGGILNLTGSSGLTGGFFANTGGRLSLSGTFGANAAGNIFIIGQTAGKGMLTISAGVTLSRNNIFLGDASGICGALYQTGGTLTLSQGGSVDDIRIGSSAGGQGYYKLSGGSVSVNEAGVGASLNDTVGVVDMSGGTFTDTGYFAVGRGGATSSGLLNVTGGTVNYGTTAGTGPLDINWGSTSGALAIINVGGGAGAANVTGVSSATGTGSFSGKGLNLTASSTAGTAGIVNLLTNGTLTVSDVTAANATPLTLLNFNGGTLKATSPNNLGVAFMTNANISGVFVYGNGATIDDNGTAITVGRPLLAPTGSGVTSIAVTTAGSGYYGAPLVKITGGTGAGATAYANMVDDGTGAGTFKVGSYTISSPGVYTVAPTTVTLFGGGPITAATSTSITTAANTSGGLVKKGAGTLTLTGANTYTGNTTVSNGTVKIGTGGSITTSPNISVISGATYDVSTAGGTLAANQNILGGGAVSGAMTTDATSKIYPGTDGTAGTLTFNNGLTMTASSTFNFDLSSSAVSGNDKVVVAGTLALNATVFNIKGPATLATSDYTLATGTSITGTPTVTWDVGATPSNTGFFVMTNNGTAVILHFTGSPTVTASASPTTVVRNQATTITATATPGSGGSVASVLIDLTQIGGSATASLVLSNNNVYTNTFIVSSGTTAGIKPLTVTATDVSSFSGSATVSLTVTAANEVWNGGAGDDFWGSNPNWASGLAPGLTGDSLTFAGTTRLTPNLQANYSVSGLTFDSSAGAFTIGTTSSTLTLAAGGVTNNSTSAETLNVPVSLGAAQTLNAAAGNLTLAQTVANNGNSLTVAGSFNTIVSGNISGGGGLNKNDNGTLLLSGNDVFTGGMTVSGGTLVLSGSNNITGNLVVHNSTTLQLQANAANTIGGLSTAIGTPTSFQFGDNNANSQTLQLRGNSSVTFSNTATSFNTGFATDYLDVNNVAAVNGSGPQGGILTIGGFGTFRNTFNITGGNGYTLGMSSILNANGDYLNLNVISANFIIGAIPSIGNTSTWNCTSNMTVTGVVSGGGGIIKSGSGALNLNAASTYTGNTTINGGTVYITNTGGIYTSAYNSSAVLTVTSNATLVLDRWGYGAGQSLGQLDYNPARFIINGGTIVFTGGAAGAPVGAEAPYGPGFTIGTNGATLNAAKAGDTWTVKNDSRGFGPITSAAGGLLTLTGIGNGIFDKVLGGTGGITMSGSATWTLTFASTYTGNTTISNGVLSLAAGAAISNSAAIFIAAGATFDVSSNATFNLSSSTALIASGTGTTIGSTAATINGGTSVSLGSQPITLNYNGSNPALYISQGTLSLNGNAFTVNSAAPLAAGTYIIAQQASGSISSSGSYPPAVGTAIGAGTTNFISVSGGNVVLNILNTTTTALTRTAGTEPSVYGSSLTFHAVISPAPANGETVNFYSGLTLIGTATTTSGAADLTINNLAYSPSTQVIKATYVGDSLNTASTGTLAGGQTITPAVVTPSVTISNKVYDTTTAAGIASRSLAGVVGLDDVNLGASGTGNFADANVGTGKTVIVTNLMLSGVTAGNYVLSSTSATNTANITPATLTYVATAASRDYGTANPAFTGSVTGFVGAENQGSATTGTLAFTSPATTFSSVGSYAINGSGLTANNGNYVFVQAAGNATALTVTINSTPVTLTLTSGGSIVTLSWPADHLGWILQGQTNSLSIGIATNWSDVAGTASVTSTNLPLDMDIPTTFYRLRLP